jgi:hypothetical protein
MGAKPNWGSRVQAEQQAKPPGESAWPTTQPDQHFANLPGTSIQPVGTCHRLPSPGAVGQGAASLGSVENPGKVMRCIQGT